MKFSVIVPAYNAEKYIKECVDSVLAQKFEDYELIIVNDGSTDNTLQIVSQYKNMPNVVIINSKNQGVFKARWLGIQQSLGEYLVFVDSDDCVCPNMLETINYHLTDEIDLLQFSYVSFSDKKPSAYNVFDKEEAVVYGREEFLNNIVRKTIVNGSEAIVLWNKVYKRTKVLENISDFQYSFLEDYVFNCEYYVAVNNYKRISDKLYFYRSLPDSLSKKINPQGFEILKQVDEIKNAALEKMFVDSKSDKQNSAAWFIHYLVDCYLFNAYRKKAFKSGKITEILSDTIVHKKAILLKNSEYDSKNAKLIRTQRYCKIVLNFKVSILVLKIKRGVRIFVKRK